MRRKRRENEEEKGEEKAEEEVQSEESARDGNGRLGGRPESVGDFIMNWPCRNEI